MARIVHRIKPNAGNAIPSHIITVEVASKRETNPDIPDQSHETFQVATYRSTERRSGRNPTYKGGVCYLREQFWQFLRDAVQARRLIWVLGFRLSRLLTLLDAWGELARNSLTFTLDCPDCIRNQGGCEKHRWKGYFVTNDPPTILVCRFAGLPGTIKFVDVLNYYNGTIESIADSLSLPCPADPEPWATVTQLTAWANQRAGIIHKWFEQWCQTIVDNQLGNIGDTVAKQSWNSWRHSYKGTFPAVHDNEEILKLERQAYYGGRCECVIIGKAQTAGIGGSGLHRENGQSNLIVDGNTVYSLDFNWHYPACMLAGRYPISCGGFTGELPICGLAHMLDRNSLVARVAVNTPTPSYPYRNNGITIYPTGRFVTVLCGDELELAVRLNHVEKVYECAWYKKADLFSEWVSRLWELRKVLRVSGLECNSRVIKLLGESLYGKFGQKTSGWKRSPETEPLKQFGEWWEPKEDATGFDRFRAVAGIVEKACERKEHRESIPIIAACITAAARVKLLNHIEIAGWNNVYYYDTDSIWVDADGYNNLRNAGCIENHQLGKLRLEGMYNDVAFRGIKHYQKGNDRIASGIPANAVDMGNGVFEWDAAIRLHGIIKAGCQAGYGSGRTRIHLPVMYRHGNVGTDGWVTPIHVEDHAHESLVNRNTYGSGI